MEISLQADLCHAYQILKKHGVPDDNIVVMMYDDIAHSPEWVLFRRSTIDVSKSDIPLYGKSPRVKSY